MSAEWNDINDPGVYVKKPKPEPRSKSALAELDDNTKQDAPKVEYAIKYVRVIEPENGFAQDRPYDIEGEIEPLTKTITQPRLLLFPVGLYNDAEDDFVPEGIEAFPDKNNLFRATCKSFCNAMAYERDADKSEGAAWEFKIRAKGTTAQKEVESEAITFPMTKKPFIALRKGHYDDNGASRYGKPREGKDYVAGNGVKLLQQDLISFRFLDKGRDDGYFGEETDAAASEFQEYAIDKYRMPRKLGKLIETEKTLDQPRPDGIVGQKTRDEMDVWKKNDWVKPLVVLRHGEYDDEGVGTKHGESGGEDHHVKTPIKELQEALEKRGFDNVGAKDGWFWDKTKQALIDFQTCAAETTRIVNGEPVEVKVTFTGAANGIYDEPTRKEFEEVWKPNDYFAPQISDTAMIFSAPGYNKGEGGWFIVEEKDIEKLKNEVNKLNNLRAEIKNFRDSCASGVNKETTQRAKELEQKVTESFDGLMKDPEDAIQELLLVKTNPKWEKMSKRIYIRPKQLKSGKVGGYFKKNNDATVRKALQKWYKEIKDDESKGMDKDLKAMFWESDKLDEKWPWKLKTFKRPKDKNADPRAFECSCEAQFFRFVAGANAGADFDLKNMEFNLTASAQASYSLAEGTITGSWSLPGKDGFDLFTYLVLSQKAREALKKNTECRFRLTTQANGKAFAGTSITAVVCLPCVDLSKNDKAVSKNKETVAVKGSLNGFAGVAAEGGISSFIEWRDSLGKEFHSIAEVGGKASGSAGLGAKAEIKVEYVGGKICFEAGAMAVLGLGGGGNASFEFDVNEGIELLAHLYNCVDFHRMDSVALAAFEVYLNLTFAGFIATGKLAEKLVEKGFSFASWLSNQKTTPDEFTGIKNNIRKNINDVGKLRKSPPEALGQLLQTIIEVPGEEDFEDILKVLRSTDGRNDEAHRLKWIIRSFYDPGLSRKEDHSEPMKRVALEEGVRKLMEVGKLLKGYDEYKDQLRDLFLENKIIVNK